MRFGMLLLALAAPSSAWCEDGALALRGFLVTDEGVPMAGVVDVTFFLYADETLGRPLHEETLVLDVDAGRFTALIGGADEPVDLSHFTNNPDAHLEVLFDEGGDVHRLGHVPYAAIASTAQDAHQLGGHVYAEWTEAVVTTSDIQELTADACYSTPDALLADLADVYLAADHPAASVDASSAALIAGLAGRLLVWDDAWGWGNHAEAGYLTAESDLSFLASPSASVGADDLAVLSRIATGIDQWEESTSWGDHATVGYLLSESDPGFRAAPAFAITDEDIAALEVIEANADAWDEAVSWGDARQADYSTRATWLPFTPPGRTSATFPGGADVFVPPSQEVIAVAAHPVTGSGDACITTFALLHTAGVAPELAWAPATQNPSTLAFTTLDSARSGRALHGQLSTLSTVVVGGTDTVRLGCVLLSPPSSRRPEPVSCRISRWCL